MKKCFFIVTVLLFSVQLYAQPGKKPAKEKEKAPTQKEMEDALKEAQSMLDQMSPEDKKMMDSMGIKMPDLKKTAKSVSGVTDKQLADAYDLENRIVPKRDDARIAAVSKTPVSAGNAASYISGVNNKLFALLWASSKSLGDKMYSQLKASGKNSDAIGNVATGLWMLGRIQTALYIMGKICAEDPANTDNLANYASMLSMCGLQESAIPLLSFLNTKFPGNSTLLNNLGQAWFGLGDMDKATKYLDSTIRICAYHPQANMTKSFIEEEKGHTPEAVTLVKQAIKFSYSIGKEERLRKLGYKLTTDDVDLPPSPKPDPLNLGGFVTPAFPKSVDDCIALKPVWEDFRQSLEAAEQRIDKQLKDAMKTAADMQQKRINDSKSMVQASMAAGKPQGSLNLVPLLSAEGLLKINKAHDEYQNKLEAWSKKWAAFVSGDGLKLKNDYDAAMTKLHEADDEQTGEGKPNKDFCPQYKETSDKFLNAYNTKLEQLFKERLLFTKVFYNDYTRWDLYADWPEQFEVKKLTFKKDWLGALAATDPKDFILITQYKCAKKTSQKGGQLADFDDVACQYHSELNLIFGKIKTDCSRMTSEIDAGFIKMGLKQDMDKETFGDQFMNFNVEVGAQVGKTIKTGPLSVGASVGGRFGVEIDRDGISDVYTTGGVSATAGVMGVSVDAGVEGKVSLVSGKGSIYGTGIFQK